MRSTPDCNLTITSVFERLVRYKSYDVTCHWDLLNHGLVHDVCLPTAVICSLIGWHNSNR